MRPSNLPVVLTIAGSDSGGEAGVQGDLKTFNELRAHGTTAITCLTAQNPGRISRLERCPPKMVRAQLESVSAHFEVRAAKTGMLYSAAIVREAAHFFMTNPKIPFVVDPVIISTSGRRLLQSDGLEAVKKLLLPRATLVTPNLAEVETLLGKKIRAVDQLRAAAREIYETFGCAALVKGGHLLGGSNAVDFLHSRHGEWMLSAPRIAHVKLHGTGCIYSAAITVGLARGKSLIQAADLGKNYVTSKIYESKAGLAVRARSF